MICDRCGQVVPEEFPICGNCGFDLSTAPRAAAGGDEGPRLFSVSTTNKAQPSKDLPYGGGDQVLERYDILDFVGEGAVGAVFRATDLDLDVELALKVIIEGHLEGATDPRGVQESLAAAAQALTHPNIVRVFDVVRDGPRIVITQEYAKGHSLGETLADRLENGQATPKSEVQTILTQLASALAYAQGDTTHGGLKPSNILILPNEVKLTDFGLVHALTSEVYIKAHHAKRLPLRYFAPEVVGGARPDHASDIYSVAVLAFELLTGIPFPGRDTALAQSLAPLSRRVRKALGDALKRDPVERPPHVDDLVEPLADALDEEGDVTASAQPMPGVASTDSSGETFELESSELEEIESHELHLVEEDELEVGDDDIEHEVSEAYDQDYADDVEEPEEPTIERSPVGTLAELEAREEALLAAGSDEIDDREWQDEVPTADISGQPWLAPDTEDGNEDENDDDGAEPVTSEFDRIDDPLVTPTLTPVEESSPPLAREERLQEAISTLEAPAPKAKKKRRRRKPPPDAEAMRNRPVAAAGELAAPATTGEVPRIEEPGVSVDQDDHRSTGQLAVIRDLPPARRGMSTGTLVLLITTIVAVVGAGGVVAWSWYTDKQEVEARKKRARLLAAARRRAAGPMKAPMHTGPRILSVALTPDAGTGMATTATFRGPCPPDMVRIKHRRTRFCIDRYEHPNRKGARPAEAFDREEAQKLCAKVGKRLCSRREWQRACGGPKGLLFGYGRGYQAGICVTGGKDGSKAQVSAAGSRPGCRSVYGVYDLNGNMAEWVSSSQLMGGSAGKAGAYSSCRSDTGSGGSSFSGVRCCRAVQKRR